MFQQIVSSLSMTPQAATQLTFYARRLKQESVTRFFSAIAAALLIVLQIVTVVSPASASNSSSTNDLIAGGYTTKADLLSIYDKSGDLPQIYRAFGVTRADIASSSTVMTTINSRQDGNTLMSVGRHTTTCPEISVPVPSNASGTTVVYMRHLSCFDTGSNVTTGSTYHALVGHRAVDGGWFAIMVVCGNIVVKTLPPVPSYACSGLTGTPLSGQVPLTVAFSAKSTFSGGAKPASYVYNFGDTTPLLTAASTSLTNTVKHAYAKAGTFVASVSVSDAATHQLKTATACKVTIHAAAQPTPTPTPTCKPGVPVGSPLCTNPTLACTSLTGNPASGTTPLQVAFTAAGTSNNQTITDYLYNFGDGSSADTKTPAASHVYKDAGSFTASVTVKGSTGVTAPIIDACKFEVNTADVPPTFIQSKTALNKTQNVDATTHLANPGDVIIYTLTTKNTGGSIGEAATSDDIADILEYAQNGTVTDAGGGTVTGTTIAWPADALQPGKSVEHTFTITVTSDQAVLARTTGVSNPRSYDMKMDNVFGNPVSVGITPPPSKQIEVASQTMPQTGPGESIFIMLLIGGFIFFFYLRNRQLVAEIKLLRNEYQGDATHVG